MSDAELLRYESISAAHRLTKPSLMVHSDNCFIPAAARRHFDAAPATQKHLSWEDRTAHFQYYDDPVVIDRAVAQTTDWHGSHVRSTTPA